MPYGKIISSEPVVMYVFIMLLLALASLWEKLHLLLRNKSWSEIIDAWYSIQVLLQLLFPHRF